MYIHIYTNNAVGQHNVPCSGGRSVSKYLINWIGRYAWSVTGFDLTGMDTNGGCFDFDWLVRGAKLTTLVGDGV